MSETNSSSPPHQPAVSKRRKKNVSRLRYWLNDLHLGINKSVRAALFPVYKKLGVTSILSSVIPGYRAVTRSKGGRAFSGNLLGEVHNYPTIAVIGDYGSGKGESHRVSEMIKNEHAHAVVTLGDNIYYETGFQLLVGNFYGDYLEAGAFFPATGNHDYTEGRGIALFDRFFDFLDGHRWYSVSFDTVEFFILDSHQALNRPESFDEQRAWLEKATQASTATWKIVVVHHPPHSARSRSQHEFRFPYDQWGVCMVMSGHDHTLQHLQFDDVHYVVNGIGGGSLHEFEEILEGTEFRLSGHFGAVFLDITSDALHVRFVTLPHDVVHSFSITAPPS